MDRGRDPVVNAARAFLPAALPILNEAFEGGEDHALEFGWPTWIREELPVPGMRRFKARPSIISAERQCVIRVLGELHEAGMDELSNLLAALEADPIIGPRVRGDSVISLGAGGGAWQGWPLAGMLVEHAVEHGGSFDFSASEIDQLTNEWAALLRRQVDRITVVTTLREFVSPSVPIEIKPGLAIVELRDDEIAAALQISGSGGGFRLDERDVREAFAIRTTFESRLFIDTIPQAESEAEQHVRAEAEGEVALVLEALRVFKGGRVSATGTFQYVARWEEVAPVQGSIGPWFGSHSGQPYVLADDDVPAFRELWQQLQAARRHRVIESALRRFGYAAERTLPEDEIVDLMIAAESLFLSEMATRDRGELRFRLSARTASLLGATVEERLSVWRFMRAAYDARSVIVHGGTPDEKELRDLNREPVRIDLFADELEEVIRRTLRIAVRLVTNGERFPPDWEELMFAGPRELTSG